MDASPSRAMQPRKRSGAFKLSALLVCLAALALLGGRGLLPGDADYALLLVEKTLSFSALLLLLLVVAVWWW